MAFGGVLMGSIIAMEAERAIIMAILVGSAETRLIPIGTISEAVTVLEIKVVRVIVNRAKKIKTIIGFSCNPLAWETTH